MKIKDLIYGEFEITDPVLIELINCKTLQRLKGISQMGMPDEYYHKKGFSRFEHSVGVMLLLRKLGAEIEEQIAGLLHDVSHTAFSHVIDWVIGDPTKENFQDDSFEEFIEKSEIPSILKKYDFDYIKISDIERFSLLESEAPNICADRVDYSLREIVDFEDNENFKLILKSLVNYKGTIVFNKMEAAELFATDYAKCHKEHWAGEEAKARYYILANVLKRALGLEIINTSDFWKTDSELITILLKSKDNEILKGLNMLKNGFVVRVSNNPKSIALRKKFRYVDPYVLDDDGILELLSDLSEKYKKSLIAQKEESVEVKLFEVTAK